MHDLQLLVDFVIVLTVALGVAWGFDKLRLPTIVGFLVAGIFLGPGVLGVVANEGEISLMAEIGVVLLLFSIGLELSIAELRRLARIVFGAGFLQVTITSLAATGIAHLAGFGGPIAVLFGLLTGLSSTAIVLTSLHETDELASAHGRDMLGILLFQDLAVVPLILIVPFLADTTAGAGPVAWTLGKAFAMILAVWLVATYVFPWLAERIAQTHRRELFTLFTVVVAVGTAAASGAAGLSLALGAFLAGFVVSESPYSEQMIAEVEPFKDVFNSLFFVSMGLLVDPMLFVEWPLLIVGLVAGAIALKAFVTGAVVLGMGSGLRVAVLAGLGLAQVGEFSFILAREGVHVGLLSDQQYGLFLAAAVVTMVVTPFFLTSSRHVAEWVTNTWFEERLARIGLGERRVPEVETDTAREGHVILVGFGSNGRRLAQSFRELEIPYVVVDHKPEIVREYRDAEPIHWGDAERETILRKLGAGRAHSLVVTTGDRRAARRIVAAGDRLNERLHIIARVRFSEDAAELASSGADAIVVEEEETSLVILEKTLASYGVASPKVLRETEDVRRRRAGVTASAPPPEARPRHTLQFLATLFDAEFVRIPPGGAAAGQSIGALDLRRKTGATILAIARDGELVQHPSAEFELDESDQALLVGSDEEVEAARELLLSDGGEGG